jgi:hypothetical protein
MKKSLNYKVQLDNFIIFNLYVKQINKFDKPLATLTKMRREKTQINKIRNKKRGQNNKHQGNTGNHQGLL